ncbi:MAG: hypothetical protein Q8L48_41270 [Archangium sp.]|nr:hypothetical protein [Archangium sp.]
MKAADPMLPPFPRTLADLDSWRVFADQLIERGDRLGPYLAWELSLGAEPSREQLHTFHKNALRLCRVPRLFSATWLLGQVRRLTVASNTSVPAAVIDGSDLPTLRELFSTRALQNLEELTVAARGDSIGRRWHEAMARLPKSCRRFELHANRFSAEDAARVLDGIPGQVEVLRVLPRYGTDPAALVSDRFEWVDLRAIVITPAIGRSLAAALAATSRVKLRLGTLSRRSVLTLLNRTAVGDADDAALIAEDPEGPLSLFARAGLETLQPRYGVVTAQAQLERRLPESFRLGKSSTGFDETASWSGDAVISRSGASSWWVRAVAGAETGKSPMLRLSGEPVSQSPVRLTHGTPLTVDGRVWTFAEHLGRP